MSDKNVYESIRGDAGSTLKLAFIILMLLGVLAVFLTSVYIFALVAIVALFPLYYSYIYIVHTTVVRIKSKVYAHYLIRNVKKKKNLLLSEDMNQQKMISVNQKLALKGLVPANRKSKSLEEIEKSIRNHKKEISNLYGKLARFLSADIVILSKIREEIVEKYIADNNSKHANCIKCIDEKVNSILNELRKYAGLLELEEVSFIEGVKNPANTHLSSYQIFRATDLLKGFVSLCSIKTKVYYFHHLLFFIGVAIVICGVVSVLVSPIFLMLGNDVAARAPFFIPIILLVILAYSDDINKLNRQKCSDKTKELIDQLASRANN